MLPDGEFAGYIGEHNATLLEITPPKEMSDCEKISAYKIAFELTNCRSVHSDEIAKAPSISMYLPSQITSSRIIAVQLEGYSTDGSLIAKSEKAVKIRFAPSVHGVETGYDNGKPFNTATEIKENTKARHTHKNINVINGLSDNDGILRYNGKPVGSAADSALSDKSENPVQNKVVKAEFDKTAKNISENKDSIEANTDAIGNLAKKVPKNTDILNRFGYGGTLLYNGRPIGEIPTKTIELSINEDGFGFEIDTDRNCRFFQWLGMGGNEIPAGTQIETIEFWVNEKWIDIHSMAELDYTSYSLNLHQIIPWEEMDANLFCVWYPTNQLGQLISNYAVDKIRLTYVMPKMSFYVDGNLHHIEYAELGGTVQLPDAPEKDGHTFTGWSVEGSEELIEFPYTLGGSDINLVANFRATPYTATFCADGETVGTVNYIAGETIAPDIPTKTGYEFAGWEPALPDTMPAENTSYNATWQAKTFDAVFTVDGKVYETVPAVFGEKITLPDVPSKTGYSFVGWNPAPGRMDKEGKTSEAMWKVRQVNVYFMDDTDVLQKITADYNTQINAIEQPSKQYYTFVGWKLSGKTVRFPITVGENDIYIHAEWIRNTVSIEFYKSFCDSYAGSLDTVVYNCGDPLIPPEYPAEEGYVFVGWVDSFMLSGTNNPAEFDDAFFDAYRLPEIVPDSNDVGDYLAYYPLYFKGGYIEAEEGYNDSDNVWGYQEYQSRYNIFVGGSGSLERNVKNNKPWYDIDSSQLLYGLWMIFGHGITEITDIPYATLYVYLPSTIKKIHPDAFASGVSEVYYEGTEEQWAEIEIGENNPDFANAAIYFNQSKITI